MSLFEKLLDVPGAVFPPYPSPRPPRAAPAPGASGLLVPGMGSFDWKATGLSSFDQGPLVKVAGIPRPTGRAPVNKDICYRIQIPRGARGTTATLEKMADMAVEASQDPGFVQIARGIVRGCPPRDHVCEGTTIMEHVHEVVPYLNDPAYAEYVQSPGWTYCVEGRGDCFVKGTKVLLREGMKLVPIESVRVGDEIWGYDRWSKIQNTWNRGVKKTWLIRLNNGSVMRLSPEHKVYVYRGGEVQRIGLSALRIKDQVLSPERVAFGEGEMDPKVLTVLEILRDGNEAECFDVATDDHYVWLPEADWTVSNCDDQSCLISSFDLSIGRACRYAAYKLDRTRPDEYSHVLCEMGIRGPNGIRWYGQDSIVPHPTFGWSPPESEWIGEPNYLVLLSP